MDLFNNTNYGAPITPHDDINNTLNDPGMQAVINFERLMKLFPNEHPCGIHGIMLMCNHDLQKAIDMLLHVTQCRKLKGDKKTKICVNCSNATESDMEVLDESLINISEKNYRGEGEQIEENTKVTSKTVIKLDPFTEAPKKKGKGKTYIIPSSSTLKNVYTDNYSQFVKIVDT